MVKGLNALRDANFATYKEKGWLDERSVPEDIALLHTELSEALEDFRKGHSPRAVWYETKHIAHNVYGEPVYDAGQPIMYSVRHPDMYAIDDPQRKTPRKPCGIPSEIADELIRLLNFCAVHNIDIETAVAEKMAYNATRPFRHGDKKL